MKNVVIAGNFSNDGILLQVIQNTSTLRDNFLYQITEIPGVGAYARPFNPNLKKVTSSEALEKADIIIELESVNPKVREAIGERPTVTLDEYISSSEKANSTNIFTLRYEPAYRQDIFEMLMDLRKLEYHFNVHSTNYELERLLGLFNFCEVEQPDFNVLLEEKISDTDVDAIRQKLLLYARKTLSKVKHVERLKKNFKLKNWKRNFLRLKSNLNIYLTMTRQIRKLTLRQEKILRNLELLKDNFAQTKRNDIETICWMLNNEEFKAQHLEGLLQTKLVKIANKNDVIISFLGSRRCNLKCAYCFSDHSHASLSKMNGNNLTKIIDMLTYNRPGIKIHFDNSLGGEPCLDFHNVEQRHNFNLAYHKCSGIPATFGLLTNGTKLTKRQLKFLLIHNPYLGFSLDGDRQTNDKLRLDATGKSTYDSAVDGIKLLQSFNWSVATGISCVLTRFNTDVKSLQKHFREELGIPNVVIKPVRTSQEKEFALRYEDLTQLIEDYTKLFDFMLSEGENENLQPLFTTLQPLDYAGRFLLRTFFGDRLIVKRCGCGEIIFSVNDNGNIYPCDSFNGVSDHELANVSVGFHNKNNFRIPFITEEKFGCRECPVRFLCGGICQYVQYLNKYRKNDVTKMECELAKFLATASLDFWQVAKETWSDKVLEQVSTRIKEIGFKKFHEGAMVYAPC